MESLENFGLKKYSLKLVEILNDYRIEEIKGSLIGKIYDELNGNNLIGFAS